MARKFTKYPQGYVKASRGSSGKRLGYGVEYRDMHTAIHGIFWSSNKKIMNEVDRLCGDMASAETDREYMSAELELRPYFMNQQVANIDEINYRDVTKDQKYYLNDGYIQILNPIAYDLYF